MAAKTPRPTWSEAPGFDGCDTTLWMLLRGFVAERPPLPAVGGYDSNPERVADERLRATAGDLISFADKIGELLTLPEAPDAPGSARAVGTVVVRLCREFAERWSHDGPLTRSLIALFGREVDVLETLLEGDRLPPGGLGKPARSRAGLRQCGHSR